MFKIDRRVTNRVYCVLITALLAAGNAFAEDDAIEIDPNGFTSYSGVFGKLWDFLVGLVV